MHGGSDVYRFGPFELDSAHRRLLRGREPVALPDRHADVLVLLASNAGHIVTKEALMAGVWRDVAITDNTIERAIWNLRKTLGSQPDGAPYIETQVRLGYRFVATVERGKPRQSNVALDALLAPYRAFVEGRAALETLNRHAVVRARHAFDDALHAAPDNPAAHIGMANAYVLAFESTRTDADPDVASLQQADRHAREACRLDPSSGEAWSTLAFVLNRTGNHSEAIAAARNAVTLEPDVWQHSLRLAFVSWGDQRVRAAQRVLTLCPELALAHWFAATVFVARQAFDAAIKHLRDGCAAQDAQRHGPQRFHAVGLHLLHGLVLGARGAVDDALEECARELADMDDGHLYARECAATTWYARGAFCLRQGRRDDAEASFHEALTRMPNHALAAIGLAAICPVSQVQAIHPGANILRPGFGGQTVDAAMAHAAILALQGKHHDAARVCGDALAEAESGPAGWLLPVDPLLHVAAHREEWAQTLAMLRQGAA
jgi:DNA-binding winged helix-turn-helix (wHTH) protein